MIIILFYFISNYFIFFYQIEGTVTAFAQPAKSKQQLDMDKASFLLNQAFDEDANDNEEEAFELYTQAAELCLELVS